MGAIKYNQSMRSSIALLAAALIAVPAGAQTRPDIMKTITIPLRDFAADAGRRAVVDREAGQYLGHPTTVLLEDGKTILCVYPKGHGRGAIVFKKSTDGGLTWSDRLPVPDLAVGRLVETPADMMAVLDAYLATPNGVVATPNSAFVSGGLLNCAGADYSWVGGRRAKVRPPAGATGSPPAAHATRIRPPLLRTPGTADAHRPDNPPDRCPASPRGLGRPSRYSKSEPEASSTLRRMPRLLPFFCMPADFAGVGLGVRHGCFLHQQA